MFAPRALTIVAVALAVYSAVLPAQEPPGKVALLAGVNHYDKRGFSDRPLQFAERDVEELAALLKQQGFTVRLLKGSSAGADKASKANIVAALNQLLDGRNAQDVVLIGLAGHGQQMPLRDEEGLIQKSANGHDLEDAFFCPVDAVKGEAGSMVSLTGLMQTLDRKGGVNVVLVDACRDNPDPGRSTRSITGNELNGRLPSNTAIVFSCAAGQQALETKDAGGGHGVFFYHVLEGLKGEAAKRNGDVTWSSLVEYVRDHTNERAKEWFPDFAGRAKDGELQTPHELRNLIRVPVLARIGTSPRPTPSTGGKPPTLVAPFTSQEGTSARAATARSLKVEETVTNSIGMKLVLIPDGEFLMGSPDTETGHQPEEGPEHRVRITKPFYLGQYEVTQQEWQAVMGSNPSWFASTGGGMNNVAGMDTSRLPVEQVNLYDAVEFCNKLSQRESLSPYYRLDRSARALGSNKRSIVSIVGGKGYRLPSEAEWEYACRAGTTTPFHFGRTSNGREANVTGWSPYDTSEDGPTLWATTTVGAYSPNAFGLYDMHGNVQEWCEDWYNKNAYESRAGVTKDPLVEIGDSRSGVLRGGSWYAGPAQARSADRDWYAPDIRKSSIGFRIARTP